MASSLFNPIPCASKIIFLIFISIFSLYFSPSVYAGYGHTITVTGQNNIAVDRPAIQTAIDSAGPGSVIKLVGTFQLDGTEIYLTKSNLYIQGAGQSGGWSTLLNGIPVSASNPAPVGDNGAPTYNYYNRAFRIGAADGSVSVASVSITGIKFQSLNRGISVMPQLDAVSNLCTATTMTNSAGANIFIANNSFENTNRAVVVLGANNNVYIGNNLLDNTRQIDLWAVGNSYPCTGSSVRIPFGSPEYTTMIGNTSTNDSATNNTIQTYGLNYLSVLNNVLVNNHSAGNVGLFNDTHVLVSGNKMDGAGGANGIYAINYLSGLVSTGSLLINNQISNADGPIVIDNGTAGYAIVNNHFINTVPGYGDILFCNGTNNLLQCFGSPSTGPAYNNVVLTAICTNVWDLGVNDTLIGLLDVSNNPSQPPVGACKWVLPKI